MFSQTVWIRFAERFLAWCAIAPAVATVQVGTLHKAYFAGLIVRRATVLFSMNLATVLHLGQHMACSNVIRLEAIVDKQLQVLVWRNVVCKVRSALALVPVHDTTDHANIHTDHANIRY